MQISVVNFSKKSDDDVQNVLRAINRQLTEDFRQHWHLNAELRLEGRIGSKPDGKRLQELRGDAILYLWDDLKVNDALGYHDLHHNGVPYGFVFTELSKQLGEEWSVTFSHEALELAADPYVNVLAAGPRPDKPNKMVFHWLEMCDAVQQQTYAIDGVRVSNFVLPHYFTLEEQLGARNDFLGSDLKSFGVAAGGYVGFFDPELGDHTTYEADKMAKKRLELKSALKGTRRSVRYRALASRVGPGAPIVQDESTPVLGRREPRSPKTANTPKTRIPRATRKERP
jgi:hypothetical protein